MTPKRFTEFLLYTLLVIVVLIAVGLVVAAPTEFTQTDLVYKGF